MSQLETTSILESNEFKSCHVTTTLVLNEIN